MKKIFSLVALIMAAFTFTSCEDVPMPYDYPGTGGGSDVTEKIEPTGSGTAEDPFNVAAAIAKCKEVGTEGTTEFYYVSGVIKSVDTSGVAQYGNVNIDMIDEGGKEVFKAFQILGLNGAKFTDATAAELKEGTTIVVRGQLVNYSGNTPETVGKGSAYIVSIDGSAIEPGTDADPKGVGTADDPFNVAAAIAKCKETGETATSEVFYVQGIAKIIDASGAAQYGNITIDMIDEGGSSVFKAFQIVSFNGEKFTEASVASTVKEGDVVVVKGNLVNYKNNTPETTGKGAAQLVSVNGVGSDDNGGNQNQPGDISHITIAEFLAKADPNTTYELTGTVANIKNTTYGNFDLVEGDAKIFIYGLLDSNGQSQKFASLGIQEGDIITLTGKYVDYNGTAEIKDARFVKINQKGEGNNGGGNQDNPGTGASLEDFTNGDFEAWDGSTPVNWKSACSASSASLAQSTDAHGGSYAVTVKGVASANKRLAYKELTLEAGTYTFSLYAKATTENAAQIRLGYVPVTDGAVGSYVYNGYETINTSWGQYSYTFTLDAKTTICLVVMNPKKSNYSSGEDVLIDDATFEKN